MNLDAPHEAVAHRMFAGQCFNATWDLIQKERSEEENLLMLDLAHASLWHWRKREDCTEEKMAIGYWLLARVYALVGDADLSRRYASLSLANTEEKDIFSRAFAYEALARAEMKAGNRGAMLSHLDRAHALAEQISKPEDAAWLKENLADIALPE